MKKLFYLLLMCVSFTLSAQSVKVSTSTNIPVGKVFNLDVKTPKTREQTLTNSSKTTYSAIYKGQPTEVYQTSKGKLFIVAQNKEGTGYYRKYIKTE